MVSTMLRHRPCLLACLCLAAGIGGFTAGLQVSAATVISDRAKLVPITVNRTLKGDRLAVHSVNRWPDEKMPATFSPAPEAKPKLPVGCEAAISEIVESPLASIASRCLS